MDFLKKILRSFRPAGKSPDSNVGKSHEERHNETGVFSYNQEGFTINSEIIKEKIRWADITELNVYKRDLMTLTELKWKLYLAMNL